MRLSEKELKERGQKRDGDLYLFVPSFPCILEGQPQIWYAKWLCGDQYPERKYGGMVAISPYPHSEEGLIHVWPFQLEERSMESE